jgi:hypothetical protein
MAVALVSAALLSGAGIAVAASGHGEDPSTDRRAPASRGAVALRDDSLRSDDPASHDVGDGHGGERPTGVSDDPAWHDVGDDHVGASGRGHDDD